MKNILKTTIFAFLLISLGSCTNDKDPIPTANGFTQRDVSTVARPAVLLNANDALTYAQFEWDKCNNGVSSVSTYELIVSDHDKDPSFAKAVAYSGAGLEVTPDLRKCTLTVKEFNALLNSLTSFQCGVMNIDIRIKATLGIVKGNAFVQYSNPITVAVTGYSIAMPKLAFVKDTTSPTAAPITLAKDFMSVSDYEGYLYLEAGNYKFYRPDPCGDFGSPTVYGGAAGVLVEGASATSINVATTGHYLVKANLTPGGLTYSVKFYKAFGLFGVAKGTLGSANMVPMADATNANVWQLTIDLFKGRKFKFKSNDWTAALVGTPPSVPSGAGTTIISVLGSGTTANGLFEITTPTGGDITVPGIDDGTKQKYVITIDVSKPRAYTYSMVLSPN